MYMYEKTVFFVILAQKIIPISRIHNAFSHDKKGTISNTYVDDVIRVLVVVGVALVEDAVREGEGEDERRT